MNITKSLRKEDVDRQWYIIDATDKVLGRLSTEVANTLRGKNKPTYTPHVDTGDHVIIINAKNVKVTGNKAKDKMYYKHTGYIGNLKSINFEKLNAERPEEILRKSIKGMLPKNKLGKSIIIMLDRIENIFTFRQGKLLRVLRNSVHIFFFSFYKPV